MISLFCGIATFVSAQKQPQMTAEIPGKPTALPYNPDCCIQPLASELP